MVRILKDPYTEKLVDYYYDNVWQPRHSSNEPLPLLFDDWMAVEYNALVDRYDPYIKFDQDEHATAFLLRWA